MFKLTHFQSHSSKILKHLIDLSQYYLVQDLKPVD